MPELMLKRILGWKPVCQKWIICTALIAPTLVWCQAFGQVHPGHSPAEKQYKEHCVVCHGELGRGGDRAPALVNNPDLRNRNKAQIRGIIKNGLPGGMPAFDLPDSQLDSLAAWVHSLNPPTQTAKPIGDAVAGEHYFFSQGQCATCHMIHGQGKSNGPDLSDVGLKLTPQEIELILENPTSQMGMRSTPGCPSYAFCPDMTWSVVDVRLRNGILLRGLLRNRSEHALQLQGFDGQIHLLTDGDYQKITLEKESYMPPLKAKDADRRNLVAYLSSLSGTPAGPLKTQTEPISPEAVQAITNPKPGDWPTYNGVLGGNRYSRLEQINTGNVQKLQLQWVYPLQGSRLETTPVVSGGIMYVTGPTQVCALDARSGNEIWCHKEIEDTKGAKKHTGWYGSPNRGLALLGDRIFYTSGYAHLICLNRLTGGVMWDVKMPVTPGSYFASGAPLVVGNLVISGIAGGDGPLRGFIAAYKATTGQLAWRFWTVPGSGDASAKTWTGTAVATGGGATWLTGSYDVETDTLYWAVGNPFPDTNGDEREGVNLYTNCVIALDPKDGKLKWYYQFTPHDLHDWDATEPFVLVDTEYGGRNRKLLLQANRNGFFYVLDRTNGKLLLGKPFVKRLNWASGIGPDGTPQLLKANKPSETGIKTCPAVRGATNWYSSSFNPETKLFYVMAVEDCSIYNTGGFQGNRDLSNPGIKYLRAIDIATAKIVWEIPQTGAPEANYSGVLSTAGGLVFYGESGGSFAAVNAKTGKTLWHFNANESWRASPMTYTMDGRQYVTIASAGNILSFALPDHHF